MPRRLSMGLTAEDLTARRGFIGGSDANKIASGGVGNLYGLWQEKTGRKPPTDLSGVLAVMMGSWTEQLNLFWFEKRTGLEVTREGARVLHPEFPFLAATLDGWTTTRDGEDCVVECKHVNGFNYSEPMIVSRYLPQLQHQMFVTGAQRAALSVFVGTMQWELIWVDFDPLYHAELLGAELGFWRCVMDDRPPEKGVKVAAR